MEHKGPDNPTLQYYPQMLQNGIVLIIDHNITRFHTYDLFKRILLEPAEFKRILTAHPEVEEFILLRDDTMAKLRWAYTHLTDKLLHDVFGEPSEYLATMRRFLADDRIQYTPTTLTNGITTVFGNSHVCGAIVRMIGDRRPNEESPFSETKNFKTFLTNNILDVKALIELVNKNGFNAVITDSVKVAATMSYETSGVTYIIGTYKKNFDADGQLMGKEHLTLTELSNKNEFGVFYPFNFKERPTN